MSSGILFRLALIFVVAVFAVRAEALTLKIATISPDGTAWMKEMRKGAAEVQRRTEGRVKFRFYPGGVMGSDKSVLRKIRIGQLHGGALTGGGLIAIDFDSQIYSYPFAFRTYEEVDYVRARMDQRIVDDLYDRGFVSFGLAEGGFAYLMSNSPIRSSVDLKGHKVWVPEGDRMSEMAFRAADISPIPLPLPDVLTGLQTGLIDTVGTSPMGAIALQWHSRVKYVTDTPLMYLYGILIVDRGAFERISPTDQAVVQEVMGEVFRRLNRINRVQNEQARKALMDQGIDFVQPVAGSRRDWHEVVSQALQGLNGNGHFNPELVQALQQYLDEYRAR